MLADAITLEYTAGDRVLTKIQESDGQSIYRLRTATEETVLFVRHSKTKAGLERHNMELKETVYETATQPEYTRKVYMVVEHSPRDTEWEHVSILGDRMKLSPWMPSVMAGEG
jgi:hypothetical protein